MNHMKEIPDPIPKAARPRDPRLDFFRGIGMFIIFMAHMPGNYYTLWIPARFGFSDATEIFVFCSGMASAIAFGKVFSDLSWFMGTARIMQRIWQVYWAHIGLFLIIAALLAAIDATGNFEKNYLASLNLIPFFKDPAQNLVGLLTLTYVPNLFDILPMYIGILFMIPIVMALNRIGFAAVAFFVVGVWLAAQFSYAQLPAEPWSDRTWFFNPFGWQLVFFTGFAFMSGWIPMPPINKWLVIAAIAFLLIAVPIAYFRLLRDFPELREMRGLFRPYKDDTDSLYQYIIHFGKSDFGLLRYIHFLALAYLAWIVAGPGGRNLTSWGFFQPIVSIIHKVGQQALATFMSGLVFGRILGFILDQVGRNWTTVTIANLVGCTAMVGVAYLVSWYKQTPWKTTTPKPLAVADMQIGKANQNNRETAI